MNESVSLESDINAAKLAEVQLLVSTPHYSVQPDKEDPIL